MKFKIIIKELKEHSFFTFFATISAIIFVVIINYFARIKISQDIFHYFHFSHIVVSAMVTGTIYYKYRKKIINALFIGSFGAIIIGSLSDIFFPYLGGLFFNFEMDLHLPIIEKTFLVLFFAFFGSMIGLIFKITKYPHFVHVFLSVFASLFYILIYNSSFNIFFFITSVFIVFFAVIIPCCISDIVIPLLFVEKKIIKN
jgi:hypothetical protein